MAQREIDQNLMIVAAVEGYSRKYSLPVTDTFTLFRQRGILDMIRADYEVLHTQSIDESLHLAEDVLARSKA
jgi:hypothetical protein